VLIEGSQCRHGAEAPFVMDQPQTFYVMRKDPTVSGRRPASEQLPMGGRDRDRAGQGQVAPAANGK